LHVQERLGHSITLTRICTGLVSFESDDYGTATSKSLKKDEDLLKAGFEHVTERDGVDLQQAVNDGESQEKRKVGELR
jgi:hypothetical protein